MIRNNVRQIKQAKMDFFKKFNRAVFHRYFITFGIQCRDFNAFNSYEYNTQPG